MFFLSSNSGTNSKRVLEDAQPTPQGVGPQTKRIKAEEAEQEFPVRENNK